MIRPTFGTTSLPRDPTSLLAASPQSLTYQPAALPLLLTTVRNEAGSVTQSLFPGPVAPSNTTLLFVLSSLVGPARAEAIIRSRLYPLPPASGAQTDDDAFREVFERIVTDGIWKCPSIDAATQWAKAGGKVWVGEWTTGVTYPSNQAEGGYCRKPGVVCHEVGSHLAP